MWNMSFFNWRSFFTAKNGLYSSFSTAKSYRYNFAALMMASGSALLMKNSLDQSEESPYTPKTWMLAIQEQQKRFTGLMRLMNVFQPLPLSECYAPERVWEQTKKLHTNVYVWGEGYQVDSSQEFSNFTPKNIKNFKGKDTPDIVDVSFGWYHEAYIDKQGKLFVCAKAKMSSVKIKEVPDGVREPLI